MSLPFLRKPPVAGVIVSHIKSDKPEADDADAALRACAADLIKAVASSDEKGVAMALRSAFEILESQPHEEGPHIEEGEE